MKPYVEKALAVNFNPRDFETFRAYMAEYADKIGEIISEFGKGDDRTRMAVQAEIWKALSPKDRMVVGIMDLVLLIMWDGLMGGLFTSEEQTIRNIQEAIKVSGSEFLKEKFDEGVRLFQTKHGFIDPNTVSGIVEHSTEDEDVVEKVDAIGMEIDDWEYADVEQMYYKLADQK